MSSEATCTSEIRKLNHPKAEHQPKKLKLHDFLHHLVPIQNDEYELDIINPDVEQYPEWITIDDIRYHRMTFEAWCCGQKTHEYIEYITVAHLDYLINMYKEEE